MTLADLAKLYDIKDVAELKLSLRDNGLTLIIGADLSSREVINARMIIERILIPSLEDHLRKDDIKPTVKKSDPGKMFPQERDWEKFCFENDLTFPVKDILAKYSIDELTEKKKAFKLKMPEKIEHLLKFFSITTRRDIKQVYSFTPDEIMDEKSKQYNELEILTNTDQGFALMWLSAEMSYKRICAEELMFTTEDLNEVNTWDGADFKINGKLVDVKSRCNIYDKMKCNLDVTRFKKDELVAFFVSSSPQYKKITSSFVGMYQVGIFNKIKLNHVDSIDNLHLNPMYFVDIRHFFRQKDSIKPHLDSEILEYIQGKNIPLSKIISFYDPLSVIQSLNMQHQNIFLDRLAELYQSGDEYLAPIVAFDYVVEVIKNKSTLDNDFFVESIMPLCHLSEIQKNFLTHYLKVITIIQNESNICHFSLTPTPFSKCQIDISKDYLTIYATANGSNWSNTLLSYSWYSGEVVRYKDAGVRVCDAPGCACLVQELKYKTIGRRGCKFYGADGERTNLKRAA